MGNNKNKWFLNIFLSILCLTFLLFLLNASPLICSDLPPLDSGALPFSPAPGAYAPPGGGFFPPFGAPYGLPYQNMGSGFMPPAGQYGLPFQAPVFSGMPPNFMPTGMPPNFMPTGMPPNFMPTGAPYGFPTQAPQGPLYNFPPSAPYGPMNPFVPPSSDTSGINPTFPVYNTGYNPGAFPNQAFYGPVPNMFAPPNVPQPFPGASPYSPGLTPGFTDPFINPSAVPYGNMAPFPGAFPQQGYGGYQGLPNMGYNPFQPVNPWQQPWSQYGTNINPYSPPYNPYQPNIPGYNPGTYYPGTGGNGDNGDDDDTKKVPKIKGHWAGTWEAWQTDPNEGVITDPNSGQPIITMSGDMRFHITDQPSAGGAVLGTIEITDWDVYPEPQGWPGEWTGESEEVILTGWIDMATRYLKARYFYYPGKEAFANYDENEDYKNIKGLYTWFFNTNKLTITDTGISGQFSITGTEDYYVIGVFSTGKYQPK